MKYVILLAVLIGLAGCGQSSETTQITLDMVKTMSPLDAEAQADAIKQCESNEGWTGKPVTFNEICIQIRCIPAEKD